MPGSVASARAVGRADRILELVATAGTPPSVTAVARELDLPLSSTADLLRELRATGWLRLRGRGHVLGRRPYVLGLLAGVGPPASLTHTELDAFSRLARAPWHSRCWSAGRSATSTTPVPVPPTGCNG